jgi:hypothetical protein
MDEEQIRSEGGRELELSPGFAVEVTRHESQVIPLVERGGSRAPDVSVAA